jgi:hypothetical protein
MRKKGFSPKQILSMLRLIEVAVSTAITAVRAEQPACRTTLR